MTTMHDTVRSLGSKVKNLLARKRIRYVTRAAWRRRHQQVFELHPDYKRPCSNGVEREHLKLWRQLRPDVSVDTLRICANISGRADPDTVPEEVFASDIERALNRYDMCVFLENKNFYNRWIPGRLFPEAYLHNIEGEFYDADYRLLDSEGLARTAERMEYPVVMKPSMGLGGKGVCFVDDRQALTAAMANRRNFVVQSKIEPHPFFSKFHDYGLNTLRVCTYKSVRTNEIHILNVALRMGKHGSLDNLTQGGIVRFVNDDGLLHDYAVDKYGGKFHRHPDSGVDFSMPEVVPNFDQLREIVAKVAQDIYLTRLASFDVCLDAAASWRLIEVNLLNQTIRFAQYAGRPFFGLFTREVVDYCKLNPRWV